MNCNDINTMIHSYLDDELEKGKEIILFTHIAQCAECRRDFKLFSRIQNDLRRGQAEFPDELEKRIINTIRKKENKMQSGFLPSNIPSRYVYALGLTVVIVIIAFYGMLRELQGNAEQYRVKYDAAMMQVNMQQKQIDLIMNGIPSVKIRAAVDKSTEIKNGL